MDHSLDTRWRTRLLLTLYIEAGTLQSQDPVNTLVTLSPNPSLNRILMIYHQMKGVESTGDRVKDEVGVGLRTDSKGDKYSEEGLEHG